MLYVTVRRMRVCDLLTDICSAQAVFPLRVIYHLLVKTRSDPREPQN